MGAYTSALYYRPGKPPVLTGPDLADVIERLLVTGVVAQPSVTVQMHFGRAIDQDTKPTHWCDEDAVVSIIQSIKWHIASYRLDAPSALRLLRQGGRSLVGRQRAVYRAVLCVDGLAPEVVEQLKRGPSGGDGRLLLGTLSLQAGPIILSDPVEGDQYLVGWLALGLSGCGYLSGETHAQLVARLGACPPVQRLMEICRTAWPVEPAAPDAGLVARRKEMGKLWAGDDYDAPLAWRWGINETW